jgi:hypothetical protein
LFYHRFIISFAPVGDKIDLLALRKTGRLNRHRTKSRARPRNDFSSRRLLAKIELQRRAGNLAKGENFGDLEIADRPAIVYLVAPTLSFHYVILSFLSKTIAPEIEIHRLIWRRIGAKI